MNKLNKKLPAPLAFGIIIILSLAVSAASFFSYKTMPNMEFKNNVTVKNQDLPKTSGGKIEKNIDLTKSNESEVLACESDADCGIQFDTCVCKTVCRNSNVFKYVDSCNEACKIEDTDFSTQDCKCEDNKCVRKAVKYFE